MTRMQRFLLAETLVFLAAATVHFGVTLDGYQHRHAGTAETVIGCVLLAALALTLLPDRWPRRVGLFGQGFALLGTMVGLCMIAIGVGPRTVPDLVLHAALVALLVSGLVATLRPQQAA